MTFHVVAVPCPLRSDHIIDEMEVGPSLEEMGCTADHYVAINGERVDDLSVCPKEGDHLLIHARLAGGEGGKGALRLAAFVGLSVFTGGVATGSASLFGMTGGFAAGLTGALGGLAINALIPPQPPGLDVDPGISARSIQSRTGVRNELRPYDPVPRLYGKTRFYPPLAARPFSEQAGGDQYVRMLLTAGYGPIDLDGLAAGKHAAGDSIPDSITIGETPLSEFEDWELEFLPGGDSDPALTLFDSFNREVSGLPLELETEDEQFVRSTGADTKRIQVDMFAPLLRDFRANGRTSQVAVAFTVEVSPAGQDNWTTLTDANSTRTGSVRWSDDIPATGMPYPQFINDENDGPAFYLYGNDEIENIAGSIQYEPATEGDYDVRVTRLKTYRFKYNGVLPDWEELTVPNNNFGTLIGWQALRSFREEAQTPAPEGFSFLALRLKTTNQTGGIPDKVSVVAQSKLPVWNGSSWVTQTTSNPAWIFRDIFIGAANGRALDSSRIDEDGIKAWGAQCDSEGWEFNEIIDGRTSVFEAAQLVAAAGRATLSDNDGKWSVVVDAPQSSRKQLFTPRNSWSFEGSRAYTNRAHALKIRFKNREKDWVEDERVVYDDGFSADGTNCVFPGTGGSCSVATRFDELSFYGETDPDRVFRRGRFELAQRKLLPELFTLETDIENLAIRRGDRVGYANDVILVGLGYGRVTEVVTVDGNGDALQIQTDETFTFESGKTYAVTVRRRDGEQYTREVTAVDPVDGETRVLELSSAIPELFPEDLLAFGESDKVLFDCVVRKIEPAGELNARLELIPYNAAIYDSDTETIPAYDPQVSRPPVAPQAPTIINGSITRDETGRATARIVFIFPAGSLIADRVEAEYRLSSDLVWQQGVEVSNTGRVNIPLGVLQDNLDIRIRGVRSELGFRGPWTTASISVSGIIASEIDALTLTESPNTPPTPNGDISTVTASVTPSGDPAYSYSIIEYRLQGGAGWFFAGTADGTKTAKVQLNSDGSTYDFRARSVSVSGIESIGGLIETITLVDIEGGDPDDIANELPALDVSGLSLVGGGTEWTGREPSFTWDSGTAPDYLHFRDYRVRIKDTATQTILRTEFLTEARYTYEFDKNVTDSNLQGFSGPRRAITIEVVQRTRQDEISATPATLGVSNPAPALPSEGDTQLTGFFTGIELKFPQPTDPDFAKTAVHVSQSQGFPPGSATLVFEGTEQPIQITGFTPGDTYYLRFILFDDFGAGPTSNEFSVTLGQVPGFDDEPPTKPANLTLKSEVQERALSSTAALIAQWDPATDNSGALRYEVEYWIDPEEITADSRTNNEAEDFVLAFLADGDANVSAVGFADDGSGESVAGGRFRDVATETQYTVFPAQIGKTYRFRVRGIDYSGNVGEWSDVAEHTITGDTEAPGQVSDVTLTEGLDKIVVKWTNPSDSDWLETAVYSGTTSNFTASVSNRIAKGRVDEFVFTAPIGENRWFRFETFDASGNSPGVSQAYGPAAAFNLKPANIDQFLENAVLAETKLAQAFRDRVDEIETTGLSNTSNISSLQTQLNEVIGADDFDSGTSYAVADIFKYDGKLYRVITATTAPSPTPPSSEYDLIGDFASLGEAVSANTAAIDTLDTRLTTAEGDITANASDITGLQTGLSDAEADIALNSTAISSLESTTTQQGADISTNASAITQLQSDLTAAEGDITANASAISGLQTDVQANEDSITVEATRVDLLTADLTAPVFALGGDGFVFAFGDDGDGDAVAQGVRTATSTALQELRATTEAQGDTLTSQAQLITGLQSDLSSLGSDVDANATAVSSLQTTVTQQGADITSNASSITQLQSDLTSAEGDITANATAVSSLQTTVTQQGNDISANASAITSLETTVDGNTSSITTLQQSVNGIEAEFTVRVDINDRITGFGLIAGVDETEFGIVADRFVIADPNDSAEAIAPFEVVGGVTFIKSAVIPNLDAGKITSGDVATDRLTSNVLQALQANVTQLSVITADFGDMTSGTVTGALIRTAASGARVQLDSSNGLSLVAPSGLRAGAWNVDGTGFLGLAPGILKFDEDAVTINGLIEAVGPNAEIRGPLIRTAASGWRVEVGPDVSGDVFRYTNGSFTPFTLDQFGNVSIEDADLLVGDPNGERIDINSNANSDFANPGFTIYNASNNPTLRFGASGAGWIAGPDFNNSFLRWDASYNASIRTSQDPTRIEILSGSNEIRLFDNNNEIVTIGAGTVSYAGPGKSLRLSDTGAIFGTKSSFASPQSDFVGLAGQSRTNFGLVGSSSEYIGVLGDGFDYGVYASGSRTGLYVFSNNAQFGSHGHMEFNVVSGPPNWSADRGTIVIALNNSGKARAFIQQDPSPGNSWHEM